jgi:hypothetical protein
LQERAEKRKKLYQKSEEKIHAKELEQTQAKSKVRNFISFIENF